ncbi:putative porphobilinogen deaminase [Cyclospora cayetanensis]|uniref:Porphobilinogen deaminase n=1 Tax=Cyclospora cayetanensis TaxID=88456 RepID=A0A1D3CRZ0_9EIME|nr:putative porphobilinogen deaminase [Cyclospora cayetanensis]
MKGPLSTTPLYVHPKNAAAAVGNEKPLLRVGSRWSPLALTQTKEVLRKLVFAAPNKFPAAVTAFLQEDEEQNQQTQQEDQRQQKGQPEQSRARFSTGATSREGGVELASLATPAYGDVAAVLLPPSVFIPALCQGIVAAQCRSDDCETLGLLQAISDEAAATAAAAERAFLKQLDGRTVYTPEEAAEIGAAAAREIQRVAGPHFISDIMEKVQRGWGALKHGSPSC